jgi:ParB family transcriptional regulator, chromosome partitioning protein|tara:strand:- start:206 stop:1048 length:843 start_codon:yes stop_codon:yes gene_type:complete
MKNKGLGRGLDALLANNEDSSDLNNENLMMLSIKQLTPGKFQPRKIMDEQSLNELTESIKSQGIMQPILVRKIENEKYEIIAGERRWQASKRAGIDSVPVLIKEISDASALAMALIENIQREDLNVIEEARGIKRLIDEFQMTHESAADILGKSRATVSNILRLLNLSEHVQEELLNNKIEMGHARALLSMSLDEQAMLCQKIIIQKLSVREIEKIVANTRTTSSRKIKNNDEDIVVLENELSEKLGMKVSINHKKNGSGAIKINYPSLEQLDLVLKKLK